MSGDLFQCGAESRLPGGGVKGGDEAVGSVVAFDRARDEAGHVQSRIAQDVQQVGEYAGAGDQRDEGDDGFEVAGVIAVGAGVEFLDHITRGDDKEFGVRAIEILHMFGEGVEIVEFAADAGAERHAAGLQVAAGLEDAGSGCKWCSAMNRVHWARPCGWALTGLPVQS